MKNAIFTNTSIGAAQYLIQRDNQFIVELDLPNTFTRFAADSSYEAKLKKFKVVKVESKLTNAIPYRINIFLNENKVKVLIPAHTYIAYTNNVNYSNDPTFVFDFEEEIIQFPLYFEEFENDIEGAGYFVDEQISSHIQQEVNAIFKGQVIDEKNKWRFDYKNRIPDCEIKQIHQY